jgi:hypothetical protein
MGPTSGRLTTDLMDDLAVIFRKHFGVERSWREPTDEELSKFRGREDFSRIATLVLNFGACRMSLPIAETALEGLKKLVVPLDRDGRPWRRIDGSTGTLGLANESYIWLEESYAEICDLVRRLAHQHYRSGLPSGTAVILVEEG